MQRILPARKNTGGPRACFKYSITPKAKKGRRPDQSWVRHRERLGRAAHSSSQAARLSAIAGFIG